MGQVRRRIGRIQRWTGDIRRRIGRIERLTGQVRRWIGHIKRLTGDIQRRIREIERLTGQVRRWIGHIQRRMSRTERAICRYLCWFQQTAFNNAYDQLFFLPKWDAASSMSLPFSSSHVSSAALKACLLAALMFFFGLTA